MGNGVVQSGDEYSDRPISSVASVVATAAGKLSTIPIISPYMRATEVVASAIGSVAAFFGWSRPVQLIQTTPYNPRPVGNITNTNVMDTSIKLTTDIKQETNVDPRTVGLGDKDEMTIESIAQRKAFLCTITWQFSKAVADKEILAIIGVNPLLFNHFNVKTPKNYLQKSSVGMQLLPVGFAAMPFANWRGSMSYRFQIIAPRFTRGRLKLTYFPKGPKTDGALNPADVPMNAAYSRLIDLSDTSDFTLEVGWGSAQPMLPMGHVPLNNEPLDNNATHPFIDSLNQRYWIAEPNENYPLNAYDVQSVGFNGVLTVSTFTNIHNPVNTGFVFINVYASAGKDMQFFNPTNNISDYGYRPQLCLGNNCYEDPDPPDPPFDPGSDDGENGQNGVSQAGIKELEPLAEADFGAPAGGPTVNLAPMLNSPRSDDHTDSILMGEAIISFRALMKRYCFSTNIGFRPAEETGIQNVGWQWYRIILSAVPPHRGVKCQFDPGQTGGQLPDMDTGLYKIPRDETGLPPTNPITKISVDYNYMCYFTYLSCAYLGWRGGHRWKVKLEAPIDTYGRSVESNMQITRTPYNSTRIDAFTKKGIYSGIVSKDAAEYKTINQIAAMGFSTLSGSHIGQNHINPYLEIEMPYHQQVRFMPTRLLNYDCSNHWPFNQTVVEDDPGRVADPMKNATFVTEYSYSRSNTGLNNRLQFARLYHSCGDDQTFFFFIGAPALYICTPDMMPAGSITWEGDYCPNPWSNPPEPEPPVPP